MENKTILTYGQVKAIKTGASDEALSGVRAYDGSIVAQYEKYDMVPYTGFEILVRDTVAKKLARVNKNLWRQYGINIKIVYGYRALEVQKRYFDEQYDRLRQANPAASNDELASLTHGFVAVPEVAGHVTGGAIDLTLVNNKGGEYDMGTKVADFSDPGRIKTFSRNVSTTQTKLRQILLGAMLAEGFAPFLGEWWHFSYGDKEWAAYHEKPQALYGPIDIDRTANVYRIAGGNETVIQLVEDGRGNGSLKKAGASLLKAYPGTEQSGFLCASERRLEMAGGEFCGNASAAAGLALATKLAQKKVSYSVSGFDGKVTAEIISATKNSYQIRTTFDEMRCILTKVAYEGSLLTKADFKGISHILIENEFPAAGYKRKLRDIVSKLGLQDREAVGVIWYQQAKNEVRINPVIWVRNVDTLYYESACGSGSIAVAAATNREIIRQPSGGRICVRIAQSSVTTESWVGIAKKSQKNRD